MNQKKITPLRLLSIFAKQLGIFNWNFAHLLCVQIYDRLPNFIQLSPNFTKLCCIKHDYLPNFKPIVTPEYQLLDYLLVTGSQSTWLSWWCVGCHASGISQNSFKAKKPFQSWKVFCSRSGIACRRQPSTNAINDFRKRLNACVAADGGHVEHTMWNLCRWTCCNSRWTVELTDKLFTVTRCAATSSLSSVSKTRDECILKW